MITENTLRVKLELAGDGQLKASMVDTAQSILKLDDAQQAVAESSAAATGAAKDNASATAAMGESAAEAEARIKAMVQASLARQQAEQAAATASQRTEQANASAVVGYDRLLQAQNRAMAASTQMVRAEQQAASAAANTAGIEQQQQALGKLLGQIDPTIAALEKLDAQQAKLKQFHTSGALGTDDYKAYSAAIDASRDRISAAGEAVHSFSLNNSVARRELGYLVKDLASGNWGRFQQSAMTLASNTGLMSMAFSTAGLMIGATVAVLGLFALAAVKGYEETEKLRVSVIATGGAAGVSAAGFNAMAVSVGAATGKYGPARAAIEQLAASGQVAGAGIGMLGKQAVDMATVTGESIDKAVASIEEIGQRPAEAIAKLNDQYHFLTAAQYAQIAALEAEGNSRAAARLANAADAEAMAARAKDVQDNAGLMERAGHAVAAAWGGAWDALKGIGRTSGLGDQVAAVQAQIDTLTKPHLDRAGNLVQAGGGDDLAKLQKQLADLRAQQYDQGLAGVNQSLDARANQDAIAAQQRLAKYDSPTEKRDNALKQANADRLAAMYGVVDPDQKARIEAQYKTQVKDANAAYASAIKKDGAEGARAAHKEATAYDTFSGQVNALDARSIKADTSAVAQYEQGIAKLADQMGVYMAKGGDATKAAALFNRGQQDLQKTLDANRASELAGEAQYKAALDQSNAALQLSVNNEIARIGMGAKEYQQSQQVAKAYQEEAKQLAALALQRQAGLEGKSGGLSQSAYEADVQALKDATATKVAIMEEGFRQMDRAQSDWRNGARAALQEYADQAKDVAGQTKQAFSTLSTDMEDSLANWVKGGKLNFKTFEADFENMLAHMVAKALIAQAETALISMIGGSYGSAFTSLGGNATSYSSIGSDGSYGGGFNFASSSGGYADGGKIRGKGTGTSDSILARLSNGEYVQTADAVSYYGEAFMDDVRAKRLPRYATGGMVGSSGGGGGAAAGGDVTVNVYGAEQGARVEQRSGGDGQRYIDVFINAAAQNVASGGSLAQAITGAFGVRRQARSYAPAGGA